MHSSIVELDCQCRAVFLEIPPRGVVLLQAVIESYENLGVVRTVDPRQGVICIVTTKSGVTIVLEILDSLKDSVLWRFLSEVPADLEEDIIPGYKKRIKQLC